MFVYIVNTLIVWNFSPRAIAGDEGEYPFCFLHMLAPGDGRLLAVVVWPCWPRHLPCGGRRGDVTKYFPLFSEFVGNA